MRIKNVEKAIPVSARVSESLKKTMQAAAKKQKITLGEYIAQKLREAQA